MKISNKNFFEKINVQQDSQVKQNNKHSHFSYNPGNHTSSSIRSKGIVDYLKETKRRASNDEQRNVFDHKTHYRHRKSSYPFNFLENYNEYVKSNRASFDKKGFDLFNSKKENSTKKTAGANCSNGQQLESKSITGDICDNPDGKFVTIDGYHAEAEIQLENGDDSEFSKKKFKKQKKYSFVPELNQNQGAKDNSPTNNISENKNSFQDNSVKIAVNKNFPKKDFSDKFTREIFNKQVSQASHSNQPPIIVGGYMNTDDLRKNKATFQEKKLDRDDSNGSKNDEVLSQDCTQVLNKDIEPIQELKQNKSSDNSTILNLNANKSSYNNIFGSRKNYFSLPSNCIESKPKIPGKEENFVAFDKSKNKISITRTHRQTKEEDSQSFKNEFFTKDLRKKNSKKSWVMYSSIESLETPDQNQNSRNNNNDIYYAGDVQDWFELEDIECENLFADDQPRGNRSKTVTNQQVQHGNSTKTHPSKQLTTTPKNNEKSDFFNRQETNTNKTTLSSNTHQISKPAKKNKKLTSKSNQCQYNNTNTSTSGKYSYRQSIGKPVPIVRNYSPSPPQIKRRDEPVDSSTNTQHPFFDDKNQFSKLFRRQVINHMDCIAKSTRNMNLDDLSESPDRSPYNSKISNVKDNTNLYGSGSIGSSCDMTNIYNNKNGYKPGNNTIANIKLPLKDTIMNKLDMKRISEPTNPSHKSGGVRLLKKKVPIKGKNGKVAEKLLAEIYEYEDSGGKGYLSVGKSYKTYEKYNNDFEDNELQLTGPMHSTMSPNKKMMMSKFDLNKWLTKNYKSHRDISKRLITVGCFAPDTSQIHENKEIMIQDSIKESMAQSIMEKYKLNVESKKRSIDKTIDENLKLKQKQQVQGSSAKKKIVEMLYSKKNSDRKVYDFISIKNDMERPTKCDSNKVGKSGLLDQRRQENKLKKEDKAFHNKTESANVNFKKCLKQELLNSPIIHIEKQDDEMIKFDDASVGSDNVFGEKRGFASQLANVSNKQKLIAESHEPMDRKVYNDREEQYDVFGLSDNMNKDCRSFDYRDRYMNAVCLLTRDKSPLFERKEVYLRKNCVGLGSRRSKCQTPTSKKDFIDFKSASPKFRPSFIKTFDCERSLNSPVAPKINMIASPQLSRMEFYSEIQRPKTPKNSKSLNAESFAINDRLGCIPMKKSSVNRGELGEEERRKYLTDVQTELGNENNGSRGKNIDNDDSYFDIKYLIEDSMNYLSY